MSDMEIFGAIAAMSFGIIIMAFVILIAIYVVQAIFLSSFNKLVYGKGTWMAWVPYCNTYLLGKLTFNETVGWVLVGTSILSMFVSFLSPIYSLASFGLFIYAIVKYFQLKGAKQAMPQQGQQPMNTMVPNMNGQVMPQQPMMNGQMPQQQMPMQPMMDQNQQMMQQQQNSNNPSNNGMM